MTAPVFDVDAVVLDLDDTLIREHDFVLSGYSAVAEALSHELDVPQRDLLDQLNVIYEGPDRSRAFNALLDPFGRADLVTTCIDTYRSHKPRISLTPDAEDLLAGLLTLVPVGVVTDGPLVMQEAKVAALSLRERGVEVVCTDALGGRGAWKPSPLGLHEVASRLGVEAARAVYIADNPHKDFIATARAGMHSIRFRQWGQLHAGCEPEGDGTPDHEITNLADTWAILGLTPTSNT